MNQSVKTVKQKNPSTANDPELGTCVYLDDNGNQQTLVDVTEANCDAKNGAWTPNP